MHKTSGGLRLFQKKTKNSHMSFMLLSEHSIKLTPNVFVLVDDQRRDPLLVKIQKVKDWGMNTHAALPPTPRLRDHCGRVDREIRVRGWA